MPEGRAERQRADIAHEHLRRVGVVPEKAQTGGDHRGAKHRQLADAGDIGNLQVLGELEMAGDVGDDRVGGRGDHHRPDGQAIESVGQIDRVGRADDHQHGKGNIKTPEIKRRVLTNGMAISVLNFGR